MLYAVLICAGAFGQSFERIDLPFRHDASRSPQKHLVETMGAGAAVLDYDSDGLPDLYFVNGAALPNSGDGLPDKSAPRYWNRLLRNLGSWRFEDVTEKAGVSGSEYGMGAAVGDYDNDGDPDLFVANYGPDLLYRNRGDGTFEDVSEAAGIVSSGWSSGSAFLDFNRDGLLDVFVAGYLDWDLEKSRPCGDSLPVRRSYCHPRFFRSVSHTLYLNQGDGRFADVSADVGLDQQPGKGLGVAHGDYDHDGWTDVFVANDSAPQQLFRNVEGRRLDDAAVQTGVAYDSDGSVYAGMGVAWEDFDNDGSPDLLVNALGRQGYWLYRAGSEDFETASLQSGLAALSSLSSGWGIGLVDFDNDGWRDLFVAQGHVMDDIEMNDPALAYREPLMLARNLHGRFYDVSPRAGPALGEPLAARGAAFADLDNDGRVDIVVQTSDAGAFLLRNTTSSIGNYLMVELEGTTSNRDAIGATVTVQGSDGSRRTAFHSSAGSYLSSNGVGRIHFGLGAATPDAVEIRWPDGSRQAVDAIPGPRLKVRQPD